MISGTYEIQAALTDSNLKATPYPGTDVTPSAETLLGSTQVAARRGSRPVTLAGSR